MANESRVFRLPAGMSTQVVANAVEAFLSSAKGMEVQSAETTEGYVVQGRQEKDGWKTIAGMRMATTVQMIRMDDNLNVTVGQGEWSDKIGAGALGWFIAWPLAVTAGVGAYKQKKLPEEIFQVIEQCIVSGGRSVVVRNAGAAKRRTAFQYAAGGMPDDRGPSPVRFGGGGICAGKSPLVGLPKPGAVGSAGGSGLRRQL